MADKRLRTGPHPVRAIRFAKGWSIERLAREAGLTTRCIWGLEHDSNRPRLKTAQAVAAALGIPVEIVLNHHK